jgi:hypothetical protein
MRSVLDSSIRKVGSTDSCAMWICAASGGPANRKSRIVNRSAMVPSSEA